MGSSQRERFVQSIIGATEKRRESGAVCRGMGESESARRMGRSLSGMGLGGGGACFATFTTSSADVVLCGICQEFVGDLRVLDTGSDRTSWVPPILGCVLPDLTAHRRKLSQPVDTGENDIREVVSCLWIFESDIVCFVFQIFECFFKPLNPYSGSSAWRASLPLGYRWRICLDRLL